MFQPSGTRGGLGLQFARNVVNLEPNDHKRLYGNWYCPTMPETYEAWRQSFGDKYKKRKINKNIVSFYTQIMVSF
jgi:hypothetical protein